MIISDLNYLEVVNEGLEDIAGGRRIRFNKNIDINVDADYDVDADIDPKVKGNTALANAEATGNNSFTETYTAATGFSSLSESASIVV